MNIRCRFALLNSTLNIPPPSLPICPLKLTKFSHLPLLRRKSTIYTRTRLLCTPSQSSSTAMEAPPQGYRRNVGICLVNDSKKIFAASRLDIPSAWQMPQAPYWLTYDFPPEVREKLRHQWGSDWKGQAQKWCLLKFTGKDDKINLLGDGSEKPEFGEWSWMSTEQVVDLAVDFKKLVYKERKFLQRSHLIFHSLRFTAVINAYY